MSQDEAIARLMCPVFFSSLITILLISALVKWKQSHDYPAKARKYERLTYWAMQKAREINHKIVRLKKNNLTVAAQPLEKDRNMFFALARTYSKEMHSYVDKHQPKRAAKAA